MKMYRIGSMSGTIAYRARKSIALVEARAASRDQDGEVCVTMIELRNDLPKMLLVEAALNGNGFRVGHDNLHVATYQNGKCLKLDMAAAA